jgi:hypothetical protein
LHARPRFATGDYRESGAARLWRFDHERYEYNGAA